MAIDFSGATQYFERNQTLDSFPISMSAFVNPDTISGVDGIQTQNNQGVDAAQNYTRLNNGVPGAVTITAANGVNVATSSITLTAGTLYHVGGFYASATSRVIRVDGTENSANTNRPLMSLAKYGLSYRTNTTSGTRTDYFDGKISDAALWSVSLTERERVARDKAISAELVKPTNLIAYHPLIADSNDLVHRTAMTVNGSPTYVRHPRVYM